MTTPRTTQGTTRSTARSTTQAFFEPQTGTWSYLLWDHATRHAAVVDPVLDFDYKAARTSTVSADALLACIAANQLSLQWILETHAHADHLSSARYLQRQAGGRIGVGANICQVQAVFKKLYNFGQAFLSDGSQFDHLFGDGERFRLGELELTAWLVPGHTPADMAYLVDGGVFVGDTLFMPDQGTARADFPGGNARGLYQSIRRLQTLPPETSLFVCHDYPGSARVARWHTTVTEQRAANIHVRDGVSEDEFVVMRQRRDATLGMPALIWPSLQVNLRAGELPPVEDNGVAYLRIPVNVTPGAPNAGRR